MRSFFLAGLIATQALAQKNTCPAAVWAKSVNGNLLDKSKYLKGALPGPDSVLYIGDMTKGGDDTVIVVTAAANKNNKALDVVVGDAWLIVEDGADFEVIADDEVKECRTKSCIASMTKAQPAYDYKLDKPVSCGGDVCPKSCAGKFNCDYWGEEEDYSCKSLEEEYGCDCSGCNCKVDHESCSNKLARKNCIDNKSCDELLFLDSSLTCQKLEKVGCSCSGCSCKAPETCDADHKKVCSDAFKKPCSGKSPTCGPCIKGYASDGKYGCGAWVVCSELGKVEEKKGTAQAQPVCGRAFECSCASGIGATGLACPKDGAAKCVKCDDGFDLADNKCVKKTTPKPKPTEGNCNGVCGSKQYKGDGNCDDENNNCGCDYDGGDCCKQTVKGGTVKKNYCKDCACLDPKQQGECSGSCGSGDYKGDGNCDDDNNNCGCQYDGGDCCGSSVVTKYCTKCKCLDPNFKAGSCTAKCGLAQYKGDGNCDDENNNCGCAYDGGDCCGLDVKKDYCKECACKDPSYEKPKPGSCTAKCGSPQYKGDGNCDDENNNCGCDYDGGDCCGSNVKKTYCKECACKDPNFKAGSCTAKCGLAQYKGDGNCDDENNNCGCGYDGGDCCGSNVKKPYCKECACKDPNFKAGSCTAKCGLAQYKGDGNCDDENNNCGCAYDGGDCCGSNVKKDYCKECKCKDPNFKPGDDKDKCGSPKYKGDGECDDDNNNKGCNFDGGDCCEGKKTYCEECKCKDPNYEKSTCGAKQYKGDGNCDDENNNPGCDYDGGDCCGKNVKKTYCKICKCLEKK